MLGSAHRVHGEEVAPRHPQDEPVDLLFGLAVQELPQPFGPLRKTSGELLPHLSPVEHPLDLGDQLTHERLAPRCPRRGSRRERIRLRQEVQGAESLGCSDACRHVEEEVLIREVAARRGVGQEQMLLDEEDREVALGSGYAHRVERVPSDRGSDRNVSAGADLPDIVQQRSQQQGVGPLDLRDRRELDRIIRIPRPGEQLGHPCGRSHEMRIDGRPMVGIPLRTASHARPRRDESRQQAYAIEHVEHPGP